MFCSGRRGGGREGGRERETNFAALHVLLCLDISPCLITAIEAFVEVAVKQLQRNSNNKHDGLSASKTCSGGIRLNTAMCKRLVMQRISKNAPGAVEVALLEE